MHEVADIDANGIVSGVRPVAESDWVTDVNRRQVQLPPNHDISNQIGGLRWLWDKCCFWPVSNEPLDEGENIAPGLMKMLVDIIEKIDRSPQVPISLSSEQRRILGKYKDTLDAK